MEQDILNVVSKLISYKSVTPKGKDCLEFIADFLKQIGFECEIKDFGPNQEVSNLYAVYGQGNTISKDKYNEARWSNDATFKNGNGYKPNICFAGHVDVVSPIDESLWKFDPFTMTIEDDKLYGRGMVDMKGAIAAAMVAAQNFIKNQNKINNKINGSISFLLTTDEEGSGTYGLVKMLDYIHQKYPPIDLCILGEPTSKEKIGDIIKIGRRGSVNFDLTIRGQEGHVAYPEQAQNPLPVFAKIMNDLYNLKLDQGNELFQASNLEITSIRAGQSVSNVIPQEARMLFNIRFNNLHTVESIHQLIEAIVKKHSDNYIMQHDCSSLPFVQKINAEFERCKKVIERASGIKPSFDTGGGTSDARFIHKYCPVIEIGLKNKTAHKINEYCKISDLQTLYNVYIMILVEFLVKDF